jgi:hypothetical protein
MTNIEISGSIGKYLRFAFETKNDCILISKNLRIYDVCRIGAHKIITHTLCNNVKMDQAGRTHQFFVDFIQIDCTFFCPLCMNKLFVFSQS